MFTEYKSTRTRKAPEDLASAKDWQPQGRRLYIPLDPKKYGRYFSEWTDEDGRKHRQVIWKQKPYCKLLLNQDAKSKDFAQLQVNTDAGLAVQVDPSDHKRHYISIPKGALASLPDAPCMLNYKQQGAKITLSAK